MSKLLTPKRLKENEDFMWQLVDHQLDEFIATGACEFLDEYAKPFATLVIADLLGVPEEDRDEIPRTRSAPAATGYDRGRLEASPWASTRCKWLDDKFSDYISERRREPREDVLSAHGDREIPRRLDARGDRGRATGDILIRGRTGNRHQAAQRPPYRCWANGRKFRRRCAKTAS